ncbi:MAG: hypothetical protein QXX71_00460 [Candidatus Nanoarchaeia archaeon]|nr:hypothetical protein [Candidatus Haiyanarchaeum thermophilum]MCW1307717.1 hypothetical protein [Candidatus Haiyanarchaeum thermophilum]
MDISLDEDLKRVGGIRKRYNIDKIVGIFIPPNLPLVKAILEKAPYIYPGIYLTPRENIGKLKKISKFQFVKIGADDIHPYMKKVNLIEDALSQNFKKIQIHGHYFTKEFLEILSRYIREYDALIYVAHGVDALYNYLTEINARQLRRLEGNLLLGTSPSNFLFYIPNEKVAKAMEDGLENMVVFESDFGLQCDDDFYQASILSVERAIGDNEKVFQENIRIFLR